MAERRRYRVAPGADPATQGHDQLRDDELPCRSDPEAWFPNSSAADARREPLELCRTLCPARLACLRATQDMQPAHGVWGGVYMTGVWWRDAEKVQRAIDYLEGGQK